MPRPDNLEIERKYLLRAVPPDVQSMPVLEVEQGWIPGKQLRERLRRTRQNGQEQFFRAIKLPAGSAAVRLELEEETSRELFDAMWPFTVGQRVRKRRFRVADGSLLWEVDEFVDRDLVLAEVELPSEDTRVALPDWLRPHLIREVTQEPEYLNINLAR